MAARLRSTRRPTAPRERRGPAWAGHVPGPADSMPDQVEQFLNWLRVQRNRPDTTVRATATAEYLKPLSMGSPSNQFGNDPDAITQWPPPSASPVYPNFWANIAGGSSVKQNGDAYAAGYCDIPTDGCSGIRRNGSAIRFSAWCSNWSGFAGAGSANGAIGARPRRMSPTPRP